MKQISKREAAEKYGVITTGINAFYKYYLTDDGRIVDSDGDTRYIPPTKYQKQKEAARARAIDWQLRISEDWDYFAETYDTAPDYFYKLGKRYGLLEEFRENGII